MNAVAKKIEEISSKAGVRDTEIAQLVGTSLQTVLRWRNAQVEPQATHLRRILDLAYAAERLSELYSPDDARLWLFSRHRLLNGRRPVELISEGDIDGVLRLIAQLEDGAYV